MDWIHCNKCLTLKSSEIPIYCGTCRHTICKKCLTSKCPICNKQFNYSEIPPNNLLQQKTSSIHSLFMEPMFGVQQLQNSTKFQWEQRSILENKQIEIFESIKRGKCEILSLNQIKKTLTDKIRIDIMHIKKNKKIINEYRNHQNSYKSSTIPNLSYNFIKNQHSDHESSGFGSGSKSKLSNLI